MTDKTVTLPRELVDASVNGTEQEQGRARNQLRAALADPVPPAGGEVEVLAQFNGLTFNSRRLYGDDQPGGYLEGDGDFCDNNLQAAVWFLENGTELRAHVTRLQAEVESERTLRRNVAVALHARSDEVKDLQSGVAVLKHEVECRTSAEVNAIEALQVAQSELTKARELIAKLRSDSKSEYLKAIQALHNWAAPAAPAVRTEIVCGVCKGKGEVLYHDIEDGWYEPCKACKPAAKANDEPV